MRLIILLTIAVAFFGALSEIGRQWAATETECSKCHHNTSSDRIIWGGRMGVAVASAFTPSPHMSQTGTIVGGRALPANLWRYKK